MLFVVIALTALTVLLAVVVVAEFVPGRDRTISRKLSELEEIASTRTLVHRRRRQGRREQLEMWLQNLGERVGKERSDWQDMRLRLARAGFRRANAVSLYYAARVISLVGGALAIVLMAPLLGLSGTRLVIWIIASAGMGWLLPAGLLSRRIRRRQKEMQKALADALDMLVICVEAGLGLNQALMRVSEEIETISSVMSEELQIVNLEMRAGTPRDEALRNLGERTDMRDLKSLVTMLIQTDRFGTSIAQALRVHSDDLRTKRRQRAEEQAAKTTIKLVIPLVLFVFPAMFVVILAPAILHILNEFGRAF